MCEIKVFFLCILFINNNTKNANEATCCNRMIAHSVIYFFMCKGKVSKFIFLLFFNIFLIFSLTK